jgi:hypothetical protein
VEHGLLFYSKRLNLCVYESDYRLIVKYLIDDAEIYIKKPLDFGIKSIKIGGQEVLRMFNSKN